jgi:hypothetical protein
VKINPNGKQLVVYRVTTHCVHLPFAKKLSKVIKPTTSNSRLMNEVKILLALFSSLRIENLNRDD